MNKERIKELAKQADLAVTKPDGHYIVQEWQEKFAELLLTECLNIAWEEDTHESHRIAYQISKHFGLI